jgi:hypothetical protein
MTTPAEYREFALDCMRLAEGAEDAGLRNLMTDLARVWMRTASKVEDDITLAGDDPAPSSELRRARD